MARSTVTVSLERQSSSYDIIVGDRLLDDFPSLLRQSCPAACYAVVTDTDVAPLYGERLATRIGESAPCNLLTFPAGESHKTRSTWMTLTDELLSLHAGRDAAIIAVGGGVVGDVAGFVAATYLRGIPFVQVPTTLLAMIDSSVGGKTGVDTDVGKNLVGAFHQPRVVVADVSTLTTLTGDQLASGLAEALKHGAIADADYFERLRSSEPRIVAHEPDALVDVVRRSMEIKADVVSADERETGRRAVLNFGHTVGHALEASTGFKMLHGEAVAVGMVVEAELGARLGVTDQSAAGVLRAALDEFRLPTCLPATVDPGAVVAGMFRDKKVRAGQIRMTLLERLGRVARDPQGDWTHSVQPEAIAEHLRLSS